jgi:type IV secretory pathway VirB4 component
MNKTEKIQLTSIVVLLLSIFTLCSIIALQSDEIDKLTLEKSELQSKLNIKNVELDIAKSDLEEAHEMAGVLFLEAMAVTDSYNELKNKCKKVKR